MMMLEIVVVPVFMELIVSVRKAGDQMNMKTNVVRAVTEFRTVEVPNGAQGNDVSTAGW